MLTVCTLKNKASVAGDVPYVIFILVGCVLNAKMDLMVIIFNVVYIVCGSFSSIQLITIILVNAIIPMIFELKLKPALLPRAKYNCIISNLVLSIIGYGWN